MVQGPGRVSDTEPCDPFVQITVATLFANLPSINKIRKPRLLNILQNQQHFLFNTKHDMVILNNIYKFYGTVFTRVKSRSDIQTNRIHKRFSIALEGVKMKDVLAYKTI